MDDEAFEQIRGRLDADLDSIERPPRVGIAMGISLFGEFRDRGLLRMMDADFVLWQWRLPSYGGFFVSEWLNLPPDEYRIGTADA